MRLARIPIIVVCVTAIAYASGGHSGTHSSRTHSGGGHSPGGHNDGERSNGKSDNYIRNTDGGSRSPLHEAHRPSELGYLGWSPHYTSSSPHFYAWPPAYHSPHFHFDHTSRYVNGVLRDAQGRIERSSAARLDFMRGTGYPNGRPGYVIDHIIPLALGGCDCPENMQWQTIADAKAKDRWELKMPVG